MSRGWFLKVLDFEYIYYRELWELIEFFKIDDFSFELEEENDPFLDFLELGIVMISF
jgi:hypothetical protein